MYQDSKYGKVITIVLIVLIVAIIGVLIYFGYTSLKTKNTEKNYTEAANEFEKSVIRKCTKIRFR